MCDQLPAASARVVRLHRLGALWWILIWLLSPIAHSATVELRLPPGHFGHTIGIYDANFTFLPTTTFGLVEQAAPQASYYSNNFEAGSASEFMVFDWTTGESYGEANGPVSLSSAGLLDLRGTPAHQSGNQGLELSNQQHFLLPYERYGHQFTLLQDGLYGLTTVRGPIWDPVLSTDQTGYDQPYTRFGLSARINVAGGNFSLIDLSTHEQSVAGETNLIPTQWTQNSVAPLVTVSFFMAADQAGQQFTIHQRANGGPEHLQSVTAIAQQITEPTQVDRNNATFSCPPSISVATGAIGLGMEYWITRDSDGATSPKYVQAVEGLIGGTPGVCNLQDALGVPPDEASPTWVTFQVMSPGSYYTVHQADGTICFSGMAEWRVYEYVDDAGNSDWFYYGEFSCFVDDSQDWWMYNDDYGQSYPVRTSSEVQFPPSYPYPNGWVGLQIASRRAGHPLTIRQSDGANELQSRTLHLENAYWYDLPIYDGEWNQLYTLPIASVDIPLDFDPQNPGSHYFWLRDETTSETSPIDNIGTPEAPVWRGRTNLSDWFTEPDSRQLEISSTRWGHALYLCHPNGEKFPIQQHATQGGFSFDPNQQAWFESYYYFDSTVSWRDFLDWWVEDVSTGEVTARASALAAEGQSLESFLVTWTALPAPNQPTAQLLRHPNRVQVSWSPNGASPDGGFVIERGKTGTQWQQVGTVLASADPVFYDSSADLNTIYFYQVAYEYGGRRSAPSASVQITTHSDRDLDGISDDDEVDQGTDPDSADSDGDGRSDGDEVQGIPGGGQGGGIIGPTNPRSRDNPALQLSAFGFTTP